jgi:hypothetical protein
MRIPKSYKDISISDFDKLKSVNDIENSGERHMAQLCILLDTDPDVLNSLSIGEINEINESIKFLHGTPNDEFNRILEIDGVRYGFVNNLESISLGEWIDLDYYTSSWDDDKHKLAAVLWRRIIKEDNLGYEIEEYNGETSKKVAEIFYDKLSYSDLWGASLFFSLIATEILRYSPEYLHQ